MSVGCIATVAIPVVEEIVRHQSIMNKLVKSLRKCLCEPKSSSSSEEETVKETLIQEASDELRELCEAKTAEGQKAWSAKERAKWRKLTKKLVTLGHIPREALTDTPWQTISVTKTVETVGP
jgi:hypothetical protein